MSFPFPLFRQADFRNHGVELDLSDTHALALDFVLLSRGVLS